MHLIGEMQIIIVQGQLPQQLNRPRLHLQSQLVKGVAGVHHLVVEELAHLLKARVHQEMEADIAVAAVEVAGVKNHI